MNTNEVSSKSRASFFAIAASIGTVAAAARLAYVFGFSDYKTYLFGDMTGYWDRAMAYLRGDIYSPTQWNDVARFYHVFVAQVVGLGKWLGIDPQSGLQFLLAIEAAMGGVAAGLLYWIALVALGDRRRAMVAGLMYAGMFPLIFLNAFVLSENAAIPLLIVATASAIRAHQTRGLRWWAVSALTLATSIAMRPAHTLFALPLGLFVLVALRPRAWQAAIFGTVLFAALFGFARSNQAVSHGQLKALAPNGTFSLYVSLCEKYYEGPMLPSRPGLKAGGLLPQQTVAAVGGSYTTNVPPSNRTTYAHLAIQCASNPGLWIRKLTNMPRAFLVPMFPDVEARGYRYLDPFFRWLLFSMGIVALVWPLLFHFGWGRGSGRMLGLLWGIYATMLVTSFVFFPSLRYSTPAIFAVVVLALSVGRRTAAAQG